AAVDEARFLQPAQMTGAELSPDGRRLAMRLRGSHGRSILSVLDLATMKPTVVFSSKESDASDFVWVNNDRLALTLGDWEVPQGDQDSAPGLFAVNADGSDFRQLVERQRSFVREGGDAELAPWNTFLLNSTTQKTGMDVLVVRPEQWADNDIDYIKLLRLNTRTARTEEIDGPMHAVAWWPDPEGALRAAVTQTGRRGAIHWKDPATGVWRVLREFDAITGDSDLHICHVAADGRLYVSARRDRDLLALWLLDPANGQWSEQPLIASPQFDVDAQVVARRDKVLGWRFTIDAEVTQWVDEDMRTLQAQIDKVLPRTVNRLSVPWTGDAPWVLIEAFADNQPQLYYLFNRQTRKFSKLGAERPDIVAKDVATMELVRIRARDGADLPVWITRPAGQTAAKRLPTVVLVHGGPFATGPSWRWDDEAQFLAARGYLVIQPQFRGTLGFGRRHHVSGWREWGKAMQTDVTDATRWAIDQGLADADRIALAGASYGGYATLMGLIQEPALYRCGVCWVGVTDLDLLYSVSWDDMSGSFKKFGLPRVMGDRVKDAADLKAHSPLHRAAELRQPLLLAYGGHDRRVPLVHGEKFRKAVQQDNSKVEWIEYFAEGHGWRLPANQVDFWNRVARFLDANTAPRAT
ncbi:prolyl oligopeptidase family serine peptidase, partial [Ideonella sp.]|uniref:S9 family peptidase n=1 Tax=Ideonella sp. TaxID=1929293 RepID=UPI003BB59973